jgi:AraC-like DNA-binding protein
MLFQFGFYSSLLLITFSQGIIYSLLLLKKAIQTENKSNYWLSLFVFLCSLYIAPWMLGFAGWYDNQPYRDILFYLPFLHLLFIGPVIFFYVQSLLNPSFQFKKKHLLHFIPGILYIIYSILIWFVDKIILKKYYFYENQSDKDFDLWYQVLGLISMFAYFIVSLKYYQLYKKLIFQVTSNANRILFNWIKTFLYAFLSMLLLRVLFYILPSIIENSSDYTGIWWHYLFFSIILFYIAVTGYSNPIHSSIAFKASILEKKPIYLLNSEFSEEDNTIEIDHENVTLTDNSEINFWKEKIQKLIISEELYKNPELTIVDISKKLKTNVSVISRTINQGFLINFNDYINNYRIEAVKKCFENGNHKKSTLLGIAYDCGFNSKATFNRSFKKNTGFSPKEYIENLT